MNFLRDLQIKRKLMFFVMVATLIALGLACAAMLSYELHTYRRSMQQNLSTLAEVVASNSTAAVSFDDSDAAAEILLGLKAEPQIVAARIYRSNGTPLAQYVRGGQNLQLPPNPQPDGYSATRDRLARWGGIFDEREKKRAGTIYILGDYSGMQERLISYAGLLGIVFVAASGLAFLISAKLQRYISDPILDLARTTRQVSRTRDYSVRVAATSRDEVGELIQGFNEMLIQVHDRDAALQQAHDELEKRVQERTAELEQEIGERRKAEKELERSLSLVTTTLEATVDGLLVVDTAGRVVNYNNRFVDLWKLDENVLRSKNDDALLNAVLIQLKDGDGFMKKVREIYSNPEAGSNDMIEFKDGRILERYSQPHRMNGQSVGRVWSFRDVTERIRSQERILEQASLLDLAQDAISVRDLNDSIIYWNKSAERLYGWLAGEVIGMKMGMVLHTDAGRFVEARETVIRHGEWRGELSQMTRSGTEIITESRWTLLRGEDGSPKSVLEINTDITEKKRIESQFLRAQRLESIGTLAGGIAHDLNNVLAPIMMAIDLLKLKAGDSQTLTLLDSLDSGVKRGADLLGQVLLFARGVQGRRTSIDPSALIREIYKISLETFPRSIQIQHEIDPGLWRIMADATQMHQVLLNLCVNARDAMPDGGVLRLGASNITLGARAARQNLDAQPGHYVAVRVGDTGSGIPLEIREKIFEPFFTTKEIGKGTGLGLSTVAAILRSHGGFLDLQTEPGCGTIFTAYIPASNESLQGSDPDGSSDSILPHGHNETILVIDDDESVRNISKQTLETFGYQVMVAVNGTLGVETYARYPRQIAVVITDMMMPGIDGVAVIQEILKLNPAAKIIAVTGMAVEDRITKAMEAGALAFLRKPCSASVLLNALREAISSESKELAAPGV